MEDLRQNVIQAIAEIARENLDVLSDFWGRMYEPENEVEHLNALPAHVEALFADIIVETKNRETAFRDRINSLLHQESGLKRLLKEEDDDDMTAGIPLHTLQTDIEESVKFLKVKLRQRREEIDVLLKEQEEVCNDLEQPRRHLVSDPLPSEQEMEKFRGYIEKLKDKRLERYDFILRIRHEIKQLLAKLQITSLNDYDKELVSSNEMKPTSHNIDKLKAFQDLSASRFEKMSSGITNMRKRLAQLWKYLDIPENHFRRFAVYTDITLTTYNKLHEEVQRCELITRENIRIFIEKVRVEIEEYWDKCLKSDAERMRSPSYTASIFNEDVLELHEHELHDLKMFYENNEVFFNTIQEREDLWNQMESLQNKEADPKRYNNRGGQLLKEEKERKMITTKLPKIDARLNELAEHFEKINERPFTVFGVPIIDMISRTKLLTDQRINRTATKTADGLLPIAQSLPKEALSTTTSSTASSVRSVCSTTAKRRIAMPRTIRIQAKRQLLGEFASAFGGVPPAQNSNTGAIKKAPTSKNASKRLYNVGSVTMRGPRKSIGGKRRSSIRPKRAIPEILLSSEDQSMTEMDATRDERFNQGFSDQ